LAVGIAGFFLPEVLGVGYQHVGAALTGHLTLRLMAMLVVLRVLTTSVCYASGNAGGIFGPSLFIGAMLGGSVGTLIHGFFPDYAGNPGAYALVGMGAAFAGIIRVPMTSVIMIFEITHDYSIIVPLMISNLTSFFVSYRLQRQPIYEALAMQEGVHLPCAETRQREGRRPVSLAMRPPSRLLPPELRVAEAWELCQRNPEPAWLVADEGGLLGVVARERIEKVVELGGGEKELRALLERRAFPHVHPDHSLDLTLERMGKARLELLPVVSRANVRKLDGVITLEDVLRAYGFDEPPRPG
jgi:CIC family chloride channel protein